MTNYEQKRERRIARLNRLAVLYRQQADQLINSARKDADFIPIGQPILIGHHSEKRDRNFRARITRRFEKSFELSNKAEYYARRARSAEANRAIFSDDPEAVFKLEEKKRKLEEFQENSKKINKMIRKFDMKDENQKKMCIEEIVRTMNLKEETARKLLEPDFCGRLGVPDYSLRNNNANIRRIEERIEQLKKRQQIGSSEKMIGDVRVVQNVEDNRLQLFFPGKPSDEKRAQLKSNGFRWSPYNGCWQAYLNGTTIYRAENVILK